MKNQSLFARRFAELDEQARAVEATKYIQSVRGRDSELVNGEALLNWRTKARHLISEICGVESEHYRRFAETEKMNWSTNFVMLKYLAAVFRASKEDFESGYLSKFRNIIQSEVFDNELEQAKSLWSNGYLTASAVIAGVVLETALRQLCADRGIDPGKLDRMNSELAKAGTYNLFTQKRITALADIRNNAAHGHADQFKQEDVSDMIDYVGKFLEGHF